MIIGTAGHIDHGKTALVRALTGIETDRLAEEKRRGITIELGFASLNLPGVGVVGIVDVPGHEGFVRTMVAGAAGIDIGLLVVAANEGVMPQTREHVAILALLGVTRAVVAITKSDLVDERIIDAVQRDVGSFVGDTRLVDATYVRVSSHTGRGIDELREVLARAALEFQPREDEFVRLPVDRVFTRPGAGTVVTGTLWAGTLGVGEDVLLMPSGARARVRGIQVHGVPVQAAGAASRVAVALAGVSHHEVARGETIVTSDLWVPTRVLRADVTLAPAAPALTSRSRIRFHHATRDIGARIVVSGGGPNAGTPTPVRVVLDAPVIVRGGDRFVLRLPAPVGTIGGGIITDSAPRPRARPFADPAMPQSARLMAILAEETDGVDLALLPIRLGGSDKSWQSVISDSPEIIVVGGRALAVETVERAAARLLVWLDRFHSANPSEPGAPIAHARGQVRPASLADVAIAYLVDEKEITFSTSSIKRTGWAPQTGARDALATALLRRLQTAGSAVPSVAELERELGAPLNQTLRQLERERKLVALATDRFAHADAAESLWNEVSPKVSRSRGYRPSELRAVFGLSRQYLMPWLEYFDRRGWTVRKGDERWFA